MAPLGWTEESGNGTYRLFAPDVQESGATITVSKQIGPLTEVVQRGRHAITAVLQDGSLIEEDSQARSECPIAASNLARERPVFIRGAAMAGRSAPAEHDRQA